MALEFTVGDALELGYVSEPSWNADASRVGYLEFRAGHTRFAHAVPGGDRTTVTGVSSAETDEPEVSTFAWRPDHPDQAALIVDGAVRLYDAASETVRDLAEADSDHADPTWLDPDRLVYRRDGVPWLHDLGTGAVRELDLGPSHTTPFGAAPLEPAPDGRHLLTHVTDGETPGRLVAYDADAETVAWSWGPTPGAERVITGYDWVGPDELVYALDEADASGRIYRAVRPDGSDSGAGIIGDEDSRVGTTLLSETDAIVSVQPDPVGTEDGWAALLSARTGHAHLYLVDVDRRRTAVEDGELPHGDGDGVDVTDRPGFEGPGVTQVTAGEYEARGDASDLPAWGPEGDRIAFVTNEADPGERRLHVADRDGRVRRVVDAPGNVVSPEWGDETTLVCLRAGRTAPADVTVVDLDADRTSGGAGTFVPVSDVYPAQERLVGFPDPEPVSFEGTNGLRLRGYLYTPPDGEDEAMPAVVWCHGGPVRQMRRGFHHMRSYGLFHAFNHVLVSRGYAVLELNYRGGIGYGQAFENGLQGAIGVDDVDDCVRAADWLRSCPDVGTRVGLWGLSYGGFLANAVATKTDAFDCAVNFAGIWDWRDWVRYAADLGPGAARRLQAQFGGHPDDGDPEVAAAYATGSPCEYVEDLATPLFALHGTDDPNVPFEQMDDLVADCVAAGHDFDLAYYPEEDHMFREPAAWRDALGRVLPFLDDHLREQGDEADEAGVGGIDRIE